MSLLFLYFLLSAVLTVFASGNVSQKGKGILLIYFLLSPILLCFELAGRTKR